MRHMNIHEEEADIALWRLCRGCLRAHTVTVVATCLRDVIVGRHQGAFGSSANDADVSLCIFYLVCDCR